ncbi:MAG TPA: SRPBCC family protein [Mycolicibacterium fallax]|nr:SRPBCC family protein [Mycolicibacterium fallax]
MATDWPKPAEGSWTEHYPDLGTGPISFRDSTSPEFYALERAAIFKRAWLNLCRVEEIADPGDFLTKPVEAADATVLLVRGDDGVLRAFHNACRHHGNPLAHSDHPRGPSGEISGNNPAFSCRRCGWVYALDGRLVHTPEPGVEAADYGLVPVHCDVWAGFVFVNFDARPRQTLREFLGPMVTALDGYPFDRLTERYDWVAHNNSNWKIFADAFQEYYHVPALHSQQVPPEVRVPNAGFTCGHFQIDGPHRLVCTAGTRRWLLPKEYMYPIERATRSGLVGPWHTPDLGELPMAGLNPTEIVEIVGVIRNIRASGVTILLIEHVMQAVTSLAERVYVLNQGRMIAEGTPSAIADNALVIEAYLGHGAAKILRA